MGALLKLLLSAYLFILVIGAGVTFIVFLIDVIRWHDKEERADITASNSDEEETEKEESESEVNNNDYESGEHNTSAFFRAWSKS